MYNKKDNKIELNLSTFSPKRRIFSNKLTAALASLEKSEWKAFRKYVRSPFFNEQEELVQLLEVYRPWLSKAKPIKVSQEDLWKRMKGKTPYDDVRFRRWNSDLLKLLQSYLAYESWSKDNGGQLNHQLKEMVRRDLPKNQKSILKSIELRDKRDPIRDGGFYYNQFRLEQEQGKIIAKHFVRTEPINVDRIIHQLDNFYLGEKLRYYCELLNYRNVVTFDYEPLFIDEIIDHITSRDYDSVPPIAVYRLIMLTLKDPENERHYLDLRAALEEHAPKFRHEEARVLFGFAQNYCIKKINSGKSEYLQEIFKLYKIVLDQKIIFQNGNLPPWDYKNIVTVALRIGEYEWIREFIFKYKKALPEDHRENAFQYNLAKYHFSQGEFNKVIQELLQVEYQEVFYLLDSKTLLLKTYYEMGELEALYSLLDSFKTLLSRKKMVSPFYRKIYLNLIKQVRKLTAIKKGEKRKLKRVKEDIEKNSQIADLSWLKEKIAALE